MQVGFQPRPAVQAQTVLHPLRTPLQTSPPALETNLPTRPEILFGRQPGKKSVGRKIAGWMAAIVAVPTLIGGIGLGAVGAHAYISTPLPDVQRAFATEANQHQPTEVFAKNDHIIKTHGKDQYEYLNLKDISPTLRNAIIATEDKNFYEFWHTGIDPVGIARAVVSNVRGGSLQGASTITQQLVKNLYLSSERTLDRKIPEVVMALKLEQMYSKDQILELYLNNTYFGEGAYGIGAASKVYFNKPAKDLTLAEASLLAGMPKAPSANNPYEAPEKVLKRRTHVLNRMATVGHISAGQAQKAAAEPLNLAPRNHLLANEAPYFNQYVVKEALDILGMDEQTFWSQGYKIHTTLDTRAQKIAEAKVKEVSAEYNRTDVNEQASLISVNDKGEIIAYVGGTDFKASQFDRVSEAKRPAGSTFKALVYATAIEQGMTPDTVFKDEPIDINGWKPVNYDGKHRGPMTLAQALARSNNIVAIKTMQQVSPQAVVDKAREMGIETPLKPHLSQAIGSQGVTLKDMVAAYSVLNNDGYLVRPSGILKIEDRDGNVIYERLPGKDRVISQETRDTMVGMLRGVLTHGTATKRALDRDAAGKTGTSDDNRDALFIGFTPRITTAVWVGNDDNSPTGDLTGGSAPGGIWEGFMREFLENEPKTDFDTSTVPPVDFNNVDLSKLHPSER